MVVSVRDLINEIGIDGSIVLVIVLVYNGGMEPIVEIKVRHRGERILVRYVMRHINVRITILFPVHSVAQISQLTQHVNVQQLNTGYVKYEFHSILASSGIFLEWVYVHRSRF